MQMLSSARRTGSEPASAVECATTERMPISRQVRRTRSAISPRLAIRILPNMRSAPPAGRQETGLDVLDADSDTPLESLGHGLPLTEVTEKGADAAHPPAVHQVLHHYMR